MQTTFNSLFDIYPDKVYKGAVVGYRKTDGSMLEFPCALETGDAVKDAKGRWTASALGLTPVVAEYSGALKHTFAKEAWIGDGFCEDPDAWDADENATLESVRFVDDVTEIGFCAFAECTALTSITIPSSVTAIGWHAFDGCSALTSIMISEGVTEIGTGAFGVCFGLTNITIPDSVTLIGNYAFVHCVSLTDIYVNQPESDLLDKADLPDGCTVHWKQAEAV